MIIKPYMFEQVTVTGFEKPAITYFVNEHSTI